MHKHSNITYEYSYPVGAILYRGLGLYACVYIGNACVYNIIRMRKIIRAAPRVYTKNYTAKIILVYARLQLESPVYLSA